MTRVPAPPGLEHLLLPSFESETTNDSEKAHTPRSDGGCSSTQVGTDLSRSGSEKDTASSIAADEPALDLLSTEDDMEGFRLSSKQLPGTYACLAFNGPGKSKGSTGHPYECKACAFYCFSYGGCRKGEDCEYCHLAHESKGAVKREEWKQRKAERQRIMVQQQSSNWGWYPKMPRELGAQDKALDGFAYFPARVSVHAGVMPQTQLLAGHAGFAQLCEP